VPENQFKLVFTPDGRIWPGYKLNASNPGQTFYNLIYEGPPTVLTISVPYPYVTVGATPIHIYDADQVGNVQDDDCFVPPEDTLGEFGSQITLDDWIVGEGVCGPDGLGFYELTVDLTDPSVTPSPDDKYYVNVHLDYGLKGPGLDANPCDAVGVCDDGFGTIVTCTDDTVCGEGFSCDKADPDRYDAGTTSAWGVTDENGLLVGTLVSADALVNTDTENGPIAIADCTDYTFSHTPGVFEDTVQNLNIFKRISGAFGNATGSLTGNVAANSEVVLMRTDNGNIVATGTTDEDGTYALPYKHKGKRAPYSVLLTLPDDSVLVGDIELKANGFGEVSFDIDTGEVTAIFAEQPGGGKGGQGGGN
jgi:hypothetical protein